MTENLFDAVADAVGSQPSGFRDDAVLANAEWVQDLQIQQVLFVGSTSVVYKAADARRAQVVALKEYLPQELVRRGTDGQVVPHGAEHGAAFHSGLQAFLNEGRLLAGVQHPALVPVLRTWEHQGTAYQAMPLVEGATLQEWLAGLGTPPSEAWLRGMLVPLMEALEVLHAQGGLHGDVSLRSIWLQFSNRGESYLQQTSRPLLLGFNAAGRAIAQAGAGFVPTLKSGFGPVEQGDGAISVRQGAWTDVYALCAVLYTAIAGRAPPPSMTRMARDDMVSAPKVGRGRYSRGFLAAIDAGLAVRPHERLQSVDALRELLAAPAAGVSGFNSTGFSSTGFDNTALNSAPYASSSLFAGSSPAPAAEPSLPAAGPQKLAFEQGHRGPRWVWPAALGAMLVALALAGLWLRT